MLVGSRWIFVSLLAAVIASHRFWGFPSGTLQRDRGSAPGRFVELSGGSTHYILEGPAEGKLIVCINGFSGSYQYFDQFAPKFVARGYRVLRFDTYGRGFSASHEIQHNQALFVSQVAELVMQVAPGETFDLVGVSMGGAIASLFTRLYPQLVNRLVLISSAGLPVVKPLITRLLHIPYVAEAAMKYRGFASLTAQLHKEWVNSQSDAFRSDYNAYAERLKNEPAIYRSLLSTLQNFNFGNLAPVFSDLGARGAQLPVLLLWTELDGTCPLHNGKAIQTMIPQAQFVLLPGLKHDGFREGFAQYEPHLASFLLAEKQ